MNVEPWALITVVLGVLVYMALPVALALIYVSRVHAWVRRDKRDKGVNRSAGEVGSDGGH